VHDRQSAAQLPLGWYPKLILGVAAVRIVGWLERVKECVFEADTRHFEKCNRAIERG